MSNHNEFKYDLFYYNQTKYSVELYFFKFVQFHRSLYTPNFYKALLEKIYFQIINC